MFSDVHATKLRFNISILIGLRIEELKTGSWGRRYIAVGSSCQGRLRLTLLLLGAAVAKELLVAVPLDRVLRDGLVMAAWKLLHSEPPRRRGRGAMDGRRGPSQRRLTGKALRTIVTSLKGRLLKRLAGSIYFGAYINKSKASLLQ